MGSEVLARLRNLVAKITLKRRKEDLLEVETSFGRVYELQEIKPYGLASKPSMGKGICLFMGGDTRNAVLLAIDSREGQPELDEDEVAVFHKNGHCVVLRNDGTIELGGKELGGLVKWQELQAELEKNNALWQRLLAALDVPANEVGNGNPSVFQTALKGALSGAGLPDYSDIENKKILHGKG